MARLPTSPWTSRSAQSTRIRSVTSCERMRASVGWSSWRVSPRPASSGRAGMHGALPGMLSPAQSPRAPGGRHARSRDRSAGVAPPPCRRASAPRSSTMHQSSCLPFDHARRPRARHARSRDRSAGVAPPSASRASAPRSGTNRSLRLPIDHTYAPRTCACSTSAGGIAIAVAVGSRGRGI